MTAPLERTGRLLLDGAFVPGRVRADGGVVVEVETFAGADAGRDLPLVVPGLVDLHVHGFGGHDPLEGLAGMAAALARAGTTAFLPTLFPEPLDAMRASISAVERASSESPGGARVLGVHLEGPFVNVEAAGALPAEHFAMPSPEALERLVGDSTFVRLVTLAPELPGADELVRELARRGVGSSLGHSLATSAEARRAARAGAAGATHLFNAMRPWHHREVGLAGFALTDDALHAELIGDLVHVAPEAVRLALEARGPAGLCLVSDALPGAGTGCDAFHFRGRSHVVRGGAAYHGGPESPEGARLAGSACSQLEMVRRLTDAGVLGLEEALSMASETPARALGRSDLGRLVEGARADLLVLAPGDLRLLETVVAGVPVPPEPR